MKQTISIGLVVLVLMNVMGYYGLLTGLAQRHESLLAQQIVSGNYSKEKTVSFKIPAANSGDLQVFSESEGTIERNGELFQLIKHRLYKDTVHIVMLRDDVGTILQHAISDYALSFSGQSDDDPDPQQPIVLPTLIRDYIGENINQGQRCDHYVIAVTQNPHVTTFLSSYQSSIVHPPERS